MGTFKLKKIPRNYYSYRDTIIAPFEQNEQELIAQYEEKIEQLREQNTRLNNQLQAAYKAAVERTAPQMDLVPALLTTPFEISEISPSYYFSTPYLGQPLGLRNELPCIHITRQEEHHWRSPFLRLKDDGLEWNEFNVDLQLPQNNLTYTNRQHLGQLLDWLDTEPDFYTDAGNLMDDLDQEIKELYDEYLPHYNTLRKIYNDCLLTIGETQDRIERDKALSVIEKDDVNPELFRSPS